MESRRRNKKNQTSCDDKASCNAAKETRKETQQKCSGPEGDHGRICLPLARNPGRPQARPQPPPRGWHGEMGRLFLALRRRPDRETTGQGVRASAQRAARVGGAYFQNSHHVLDDRVFPPRCCEHPRKRLRTLSPSSRIPGCNFRLSTSAIACQSAILSEQIAVGHPGNPLRCSIWRRHRPNPWDFRSEQ